MSSVAGTSPFTGLSCYTANLLAYLDAADGTALDRFAASVRLAVRADEPAFSHHDVPLDRLPDGSVLRYASADGVAETVAGLRAEVEAHGRVIVVVDNARLPWSPSFGTDATAPHWLLVDGVDGSSWHFVDHFSGLLPTGEQLPADGTLDTEALMRAMDGPRVLTAMQARRGALVFGHPVEVPAAGRMWLARVASGPRLHSPTGVGQFGAQRRPGGAGSRGVGPGGAGPGGGRWLLGAVDALPFLSEMFRADPLGAAAECLDDLWTAAGHHVFKYRRAGAEDAVDAWRQLPGALRFAVDSARRGRSRESLVELTFRNLLHIETGQDGVLPARGRTAP